MKRIFTGLILILFVMAFIPLDDLHAEQFNGGYSYQYVTEARTIPKKTWRFTSHSRLGYASTDDGSYTSIGAASSMNYGLMNRLELELTSMLYQTLKYPVTTASEVNNVPDGGWLRWKYGNFRFTDRLFFGVQGTLRNTIADTGNVWLEPYYSTGYAIGINYLFSYYFNPAYPEDGLQIHVNDGFLIHDDAEEVGSSTVAFQAATAVYYPFKKKWTYILESHGMFYLQKREDFDRMYSMESFWYATSSIRYTFNENWSIMSGVDLRIYSAENETLPSLQPGDFPDYPTFRGTTKLMWTPRWGYDRVKERRLVGGRHLPITDGYSVYDRMTVYDWGGYVEKDIEQVEIELDKIRRDRQKAEKDLQKIKHNIRKKQRASGVEMIEEPMEAETEAVEEPADEMMMEEEPVAEEEPVMQEEPQFEEKPVMEEDAPEEKMPVMEPATAEPDTTNNSSNSN